MPTLLPLARGVAVLLAVLAEIGAAHAAERTPPVLRQARIDPAPLASPRYLMTARMAPAAKSGDLVESARFALIATIAPQPTANCGASDVIFANGFDPL